MTHEEKNKQFEELCRPLMEFLAKNHHPHTSIILTSTRGEIVEGVMATREILDYIED